MVTFKLYGLHLPEFPGQHVLLLLSVHPGSFRTITTPGILQSGEKGSYAGATTATSYLEIILGQCFSRWITLMCGFQFANSPTTMLTEEF